MPHSRFAKTFEDSNSEDTQSEDLLDEDNPQEVDLVSIKNPKTQRRIDTSFTIAPSITTWTKLPLTLPTWQNTRWSVTLRTNLQCSRTSKNGLWMSCSNRKAGPLPKSNIWGRIYSWSSLQTLDTKLLPWNLNLGSLDKNPCKISCGYLNLTLQVETIISS